MGGLVCAMAWAQPRLYLKSGRAPAAEYVSGGLAAAVAPSARPGHFILQFNNMPGRTEMGKLEAEGVRVLAYVPDNALMVAAPAGYVPDMANLAWAGTMLMSDKLSPKLVYTSQTLAVAEFHPDVTGDRARQVVMEAGLMVQENPDVLANQLLVKGEAVNLWRLAEKDEVDYLFPASAELASGTPVHGCAGAVTSAGAVGQYIARIGDGWDGPGQNSALLHYAFQSMTKRLAANDVRAQFSRALTEWSRYIQVDFVESTDPQAADTVGIEFVTGAHGDAYPFDGPGGVLAHTFYPSPPNPEPLAGDMHLDDDETWQIGAGTDLYSVVLHEMGHALGLGHSDNPGDVMYPYYRLTEKLTDDDIESVRQLYAARDASAAPPPLVLEVQQPAYSSFSTRDTTVALSGAVAGGTGEVTVGWQSGSGGGQTVAAADGPRTWDLGVVPLVAGENRITVTATDTSGETAVQVLTITREETNKKPGAPVPPEPVIIHVTDPPTDPGRTTASAITVSGTAQHDSGITRVDWNNSQGGAGTANGTTLWSAGPIPLRPGPNVLTFTAWCGAGTSASASVSITYVQPQAVDTTAPSLTVVAPASTMVATAGATISLRGVAQDDVGVVAVKWSSSGGASGQAAGTTSWGAMDIPLLVGSNTIVIRAYDAAGNMAWRSLTVTRR